MRPRHLNSPAVARSHSLSPYRRQASAAPRQALASSAINNFHPGGGLEIPCVLAMDYLPS